MSAVEAMTKGEKTRAMILDEAHNLEDAASARYGVTAGLGRAVDKLAKNTLVIEKTPGPEILRPDCYTGDHGLMITERAPYGMTSGWSTWEDGMSDKIQWDGK